MRVWFIAILVLLGILADLSAPPHATAGGAWWFPVAEWEVESPPYPVHLGEMPGDDWHADHALLGFDGNAGVVCWSRATRPAGSNHTGQFATAHDIAYKVVWYAMGSGQPAETLVCSQAAARAHALAGTSEILQSGGGDFGACAITGDLVASATTGTQAAPYTHSPVPALLVQAVNSDLAQTGGVTIHPTAGVTRPGSFKGYGSLTWFSDSMSVPPP